MRVIGTAGHVDHGKSALVAALTGIHPDRLKEEKEREMTIDLGFAWLPLPAGEEIGIVDVPGHRDFIENMLAGVGGIDAALLVIAADEGVMPQTREHLAILDLLQIKSGIVVLSKVDLVEDTAWLDLVETDVRALLQDSTLREAPILGVSAKTGFHIQELKLAIQQILEQAPPRQDLRRPRLPVDRVFTIAGFGTVVTGTLLDGRFSLGDEVEILPSGLQGRIRGLQTHKKKEEAALPGSRTAINLSGVSLEELKRGDVVTHPNQYKPTRLMDVSFHLLPDASTPLHHHMEGKLFIGASETMVNIRLLGVEILRPGESGWLQLELQAPVVSMRGDRFILRRPSPSETLGGGSVVDPHPGEHHRRFDQSVMEALKKLEHGTPAEILLQSAFSSGPSTASELVARSHMEPASASPLIKELVDGKQLIVLDAAPVSLESMVIHQARWDELKRAAVSILEAYHQSFPLRRGIPREELKTRLKTSPRIFNLSISLLASQQVLLEYQHFVSLPSHEILFTPSQQATVNKLFEEFAASPYAPPSSKECISRVGEDVFTALREMNELVAVSDEVVFRRRDYEIMLAGIQDLLKEKKQVSLAEVRDLFQTSRKFIQPLLEHLDSSGVTIREGDFRRLRA